MRKLFLALVFTSVLTFSACGEKPHTPVDIDDVEDVNEEIEAWSLPNASEVTDSYTRYNAIRYAERRADLPEVTLSDRMFDLYIPKSSVPQDGFPLIVFFMAADSGMAVEAKTILCSEV
jgi:hypothetical protein